MTPTTALSFDARSSSSLKAANAFHYSPRLREALQVECDDYDALIVAQRELVASCQKIEQVRRVIAKSPPLVRRVIVHPSADGLYVTIHIGDLEDKLTSDEPVDPVVYTAVSRK